jgi:hypothetical protein
VHYAPYTTETTRYSWGNPKTIKKVLYPPFILIRRDGETWVYYDPKDLAAACRNGKLPIHDYVTEGLKRYRIFHEFIIRDDRGTTVTKEDVAYMAPYAPSRRERGFPGIWRYRKEIARHAESLGLPIPNTGKHRGGCYYRRIHFLNVHREAAYVECDEDYAEIKVKGKIKLPPNNWDDIPFSNRYINNWKRYRKTQWK